MPRQRASTTAHAIQTSLAIVLLALVAGGAARAQEVPLEYQVKAVYLFNFVKFVRWPATAKPAPITICVAERNPFGDALHEAIRGEVVEDRPVEARVIREPDAACNVVFVPREVDAKPYLTAARGTSTLLVGEKQGFLAQGGIVNFIIENGSVRFEIDDAAAQRAELRISSHLLRLGRRG